MRSGRTGGGSEAGKPPLEPLYTQKDVERLRPLYRPHALRPSDGGCAGHQRPRRRGRPHARLGEPRGDGRGGRPEEGRGLLRRHRPARRAAAPRSRAVQARRPRVHGIDLRRPRPPSLQETAVEAREAVEGAIEQRRARSSSRCSPIGRTQLLLYLLAGAFKRKTLTPFPIYIDSPMAIEATEIYRKHVELFDEEALAMQKSGELRDAPAHGEVCPKAADSPALSTQAGPVHGHGRRRHVHRRAHPAPPAATTCPTRPRCC